VISILCYWFGIVSDNYSWVDKIWSVIPAYYAAHFTFMPAVASLLRCIDAGKASCSANVPALPFLMFVVIFLWGARLTYNFARKGGYTLKGEDYRWPVMRERYHWIAFQLLNLVFIAPFQNVLLLWITAPVYICARLSGPSATVFKLIVNAPSASHAAALGKIDTTFGALFHAPSVQALVDAMRSIVDAVIAAFQSVFVDGSMRVQHVSAGWATLTPAVLGLLGVFLLLLLIETIADQQQWNFQNAKYALEKSKWATSSNSEIRDGFCHSGLFAWSRHPNFIAEQTMWWVIYAISVAATKFEITLNWTIVGTAFLTLLFQGSTALTEALTLEKYPAYKLYQKHTSRFLPWFPSSIKCYADELAAKNAKKSQ
jgi:steroid 5-alpha reductase family enzyme